MICICSCVVKLLLLAAACALAFAGCGSTHNPTPLPVTAPAPAFLPETAPENATLLGGSAAQGAYAAARLPQAGFQGATALDSTRVDTPPAAAPAVVTPAPPGLLALGASAGLLALARRLRAARSEPVRGTL